MIIKPFYKSFYLKTLHKGLFQEAADLELHSGEKFWNIEDIRYQMTDVSNHGWFITHCHLPAAYVIFKALDQCRQIEIVNLVIDPDFRRQRLATLILHKLENWKGIMKDSISAVVSDQNKFAHLFFKSNGYTAKVESDNSYRFERIANFSLEMSKCSR